MEWKGMEGKKRKEGRMKGRQEGRKESRKEGSKDGRKEGSKGGRREGREGRKSTNHASAPSFVDIRSEDGAIAPHAHQLHCC